MYVFSIRIIVSCFNERWIEANSDQTSDSKMMFLEGSVIYSAWIEYINFKNTVIIVLFVESFINNARANIIKRD